MTKAARIRELLTEGKRQIEIHRLTGYSHSYIGNVAEERQKPGIMRKRTAKWLSKNPRDRQPYNKAWKKAHPEATRRFKRENLARHRVATRYRANNHYRPWLDEDKRYLRKFGQTKTIRELAIDLGRTYAAVLCAGHIFDIDLRGDKSGVPSTRQAS